jgi:hypothetical protein
MSLRLLIDMNLSPDWVAELSRHGYFAIPPRIWGRWSLQHFVSTKTHWPQERCL